MQTCKILPRAKSVTFSNGICFCNNFHHIKQHYNGTSCLKVNQKILQYAGNLYSSGNKKKKISECNKLIKQCFQGKKINMKYKDLIKTSNFCTIGKSQKYILKFNLVYIFKIINNFTYCCRHALGRIWPTSSLEKIIFLFNRSSLSPL